MRKPVVVVAAVCAMLVAGCTNQNSRIAFDGKYFRAKVSKVDGQRDHFIVTVPGVSQSLAGARAAARYEAIRYCVGTYGSSDILWTVGPDTPADQLRIAKDTLRYQGICPQAVELT